jgi:hypothetical protein
MKLLRACFVVPAASLVLAVGAGSGACTSSVNITFPADAALLPPTFTLPSDVPRGCNAQVYYEVTKSSLCPVGPTWFLCDGTAFTEYYCSQPEDGWTVVSGVSDPGDPDDTYDEDGSARDTDAATNDAGIDAGAKVHDGATEDGETGDHEAGTGGEDAATTG